MGRDAGIEFGHNLGKIIYAMDNASTCKRDNMIIKKLVIKLRNSLKWRDEHYALNMKRCYFSPRDGDILSFYLQPLNMKNSVFLAFTKRGDKYGHI